uniref:Uncharacterized protein n=1 Tax=Oryza brachyantha TaxID=4533 RepID=J3N8X9_ORYBR
MQSIGQPSIPSLFVFILLSLHMNPNFHFSTGFLTLVQLSRYISFKKLM